MNGKLIPKAAVWLLLAAGLLLPVAICVVFGLAGLLGATGDAVGSFVLGWIARALGILWVLDLVVLLLAQAAASLLTRDEPPPPGD